MEKDLFTKGAQPSDSALNQSRWPQGERVRESEKDRQRRCTSSAFQHAGVGPVDASEGREVLLRMPCPHTGLTERPPKRYRYGTHGRAAQASRSS